MYFLSLKNYLVKHQRVLTSTKEDVLQVLATNSFDLLKTEYKLLTTLARKNIGDC
jgi:hypothetical protein